MLATVDDLYNSKAVLVLGADLALEHPLLSFQVRANYRHHQAHVYVVTEKPVREDKYAAAIVRGRDYESLRDKLKLERDLVILFDDSYTGDDVRNGPAARGAIATRTIHRLDRRPVLLVHGAEQAEGIAGDGGKGS